MVVAQHTVILTNVYEVKGLKSVNQQVSQTAASHSKLNTAMETSNKKGKDFLTQFTRMRWVLVNLAMAAALAYGAFKVFLKPAIELETEMVTVRKRTNMTKEAIGELEEQFIKLSRTMPLSAIELAKIGGIAGQLGIRGSTNILEFSRVVAMMGSATVLSTEEAGLALAKLSKAFDFPISQVENMGSVINELSNTTAANSKEIVSAMTRMAASAHQLGITQEMAAAISATLIDMGLRAERSGTRMRSAFTRMATEPEKIAELFRKITKNVSITGETIKQKIEEDANNAFMETIYMITQIETGTERVAVATDIFGRIGASAINGLVSRYLDLQKNIIIASDEFKNARSLQEEYNIALETTMSQWTIFWGNINASILDVTNNQDRFFGKFFKNLNDANRDMRLFGDLFKEMGFREPEVKGGFWAGKAEPTLMEKISPETRERMKKLSEAGITFPTKAYAGLPEYVKQFEQIVNLAYAEYETTGDTEEVRKRILNLLEKEQEAKKILLPPEEEATKIKELKDVIVARGRAREEGIEAEIDAYNKEVELKKKIDDLNLKELQKTKILEEAQKQATIELGLNIGDTINNYEGLENALNEYVKAREEADNIEGKSLKTREEDARTLKYVIEMIKEANDEYTELIPTLQEIYDETHKVTKATDDYKLANQALQRELGNVGDNLSGVRDQIRDVNNEISNILGRRWKISGISETEIGHLITQQELELKKARFATYGLGTAEEFLRNASILTADGINEQTDAIQKLIKATETGEDRYDAWKNALQETIRALLISSQDIDRDVTDVVRKAQTELLSITQFDRRGGDQFTAMEGNLDFLGQAQDIFFGDETEKLKYSEMLREDRINGMNLNAAQAISNLENERTALSVLIGEEQYWINQQEDLRAEMELNRLESDKLTGAYDRQYEALERLRSSRDRGGGGYGGSSTFGAGLPGGGSAFGGGPLINGQPAQGTGTTEDPYHDFISRPGQPMQSFHPQDTIIGVKEPGKIGGKTISVGSIIIQGYNKNPRELAIEVKRQIMSLA